MTGREHLAVVTVAVSLAGLPFIVPHVVEDFALGIAQRVGLSTGSLAFLVGGYLALQSFGLILLARGHRAGWIVTFWIALIWLAGAVVDHGPALLAGPFREGASSVTWALGLMATQAAVAVLAAVGWLRGGRS
jgi:hypothetical protein